MRGFFDPWRRRIGIGLMLIWFPLTVIWLRSQFIGDVYAIQTGDQFWTFYSAWGQISWNMFTVQPEAFGVQGIYNYPLDYRAPRHEPTHRSACYLAAIIPPGLVSL